MSSLKDLVPAAIPSQSLKDALFGQLLAPIFGQKEALSNILNLTDQFHTTETNDLPLTLVHYNMISFSD